VKRLRRGMLLREREQLRTEVLARQISQAYERAARYGLSGQCAAAMELTGEQAKLMHESCTGEEPGGIGCLCTHHDVARVEGHVVSGVLPEPALPQ
jgi:hypothetical protein